MTEKEKNTHKKQNICSYVFIKNLCNIKLHKNCSCKLHTLKCMNINITPFIWTIEVCVNKQMHYVNLEYNALLSFLI